MIVPRAILALMIAAFCWQCEQFISHNGPTFDEAVHVTAGHSYWVTGDFRLNHEDPPFAKLFWTLPNRIVNPPPFVPDPEQWAQNKEWLIGQQFTYANDRPWQQIINPARRVNVVFGVGVIVVLAWWTRRWTGNPWAGVFAGGLVAFDPNFVAHSSILSTDASLAFWGLLATERAWRYLKDNTNFNLWTWGIATGLMLGSKFSAVLVIAGWVVGLVVYLLMGGILKLPSNLAGEGLGVRGRLSQSLPLFIRLFVITIITLAAVYFFVGFPTWAKGLKYQLMRASHSEASYFLMGEVSPQGWYYYFPVAMALKLPIGTLVLLALAAILILENKFRRFPGFGSIATWFVLISVIVLGAMLCISRVNLGIRVMLIIMPFLYLSVARWCIAGLQSREHRICCSIAIVLLVLNIISCIRSSPYPLSYFNNVDGPSFGVRYLGDSNLDWGQGLPALKEYLDREKIEIIYLSYYGTAEPNHFGIRYQLLPCEKKLSTPVSERIPRDSKRHILAIGATNLQGIYLESPDTYRFLRDSPPTAIIGGCIWIWDVTNDPITLAHVRSLSP